MELNQEQVNRKTRDVILSMVQDRPCSIRQITTSCRSRNYEVVKLLSDMVRSGQILVKSTNEGIFVVRSHAGL